ncbi:MAG: TadE/TadG family type IV pilus assembly protein [Pseudomonadota bacterium]
MSRFFKLKNRDFADSESGISAVEFALIAPLMAIIYFGCIELSFMMTLDRKVTGATAALGDLTARASNITDAELSDIFEATRMVMQPSDISKADMRVTSLLNDDTDTDTSDGVDTKVVWSDGCGNLTALAADSVVTIPANLVPANGTIIMAEIEYPFNSPIGFFFQTEKDLTDKFYLRPRRVDSITRDASAGSVTCGFTPAPVVP